MAIISEDIKTFMDKVSDTVTDKLLEQLNNLIEKGLLVVRKGEPDIYIDFTLADKPHQLKFGQSIKLELKDREYIEKLEQENKDLKQFIYFIEHRFKELKDEK